MKYETEQKIVWSIIFSLFFVVFIFWFNAPPEKPKEPVYTFPPLSIYSDISPPPEFEKEYVQINPDNKNSGFRVAKPGEIVKSFKFTNVVRTDIGTYFVYNIKDLVCYQTNETTYSKPFITKYGDNYTLSYISRSEILFEGVPIIENHENKSCSILYPVVN